MKTKFFAPLIIFSSFISTAPALVGCAQQTSYHTLSFSTTCGVIKASGSKQWTTNIEINKKWKDITKPELEMPSDSKHTFKFWSLDRINPIPDDYVFTKDTSIFAVIGGEHTVGGYTIFNNQIYTLCKDCQEMIPLTDAEITALNNKFLIEENGKYRLADNLNEEFAKATGDLHIHLIKSSDFVVYLGDQPEGNKKAIYINGLFDYNGNKNANVQCWRWNDEGKQSVCFNRNIDLYFTNCIMNGVVRNADNSWYPGIASRKLRCNKCDFTGTQALYCDDTEFKDCTFDARCKEATVVDYSLYLYNEMASFYNCKFISWGKAVKVYNEGASEWGDFLFDNCDFAFEYKPQASVKAAIQIDSTYVKYFNITMNKCTIKLNSKSSGEEKDGYTSRWNDSYYPSKSRVHDNP